MDAYLSVLGYDFNPRSPCGERRTKIFMPYGIGLNFNPRSPCGERPSAPGCW